MELHVVYPMINAAQYIVILLTQLETETPIFKFFSYLYA